MIIKISKTNQLPQLIKYVYIKKSRMELWSQLKY